MPDAVPDQYVLVERDDPVAVVTLNRPEKLNALNWALMAELADKLEALDGDEAIRCIVLTGAGDKAFAAGADIGEMSGKGAVDMASPTGTEAWERIRRIRTPLIAAVGGYALGGGDELALRCDLIVASENARFGQPEISLGVMPGGGGTQLLALTIGKYRALELCLTGRQATAQEMYDWGVVNRVVPQGQHLNAAKQLAQEVAKQAPIAARFIKEAARTAFEMPLDESLAYSGRLFALLFASEDQKEGMRAFLAKQQPHFQGK
jgi:enoyl-CoA hydratase